MLSLQRVKYFNSIKVQLKRVYSVVFNLCELYHFNSIKVQLKRVCRRICPTEEGISIP